MSTDFEDSSQPVAPGVAAAWGLGRQPTRSARQALSLARIVDAGLRVAAREGIAALSMARVASALDAATMSLYRHVASKEELLAHLVDAAYEGAPAPPQPSEGWRASLARWARDHMAVLRHHVWLSSVPSAGPPLMPNQVLWFERGLECLQRSGLPEAEKPAVLLLVSGFVRNEAALAAQAPPSGQVTEAPSSPRASYGQLLAQLADPVRFPAIHAALAAGGFELPDADSAFEFGLTRVLDGVDALVRARRAGR